MTAEELKDQANNLRRMASRGILRVTHNGKTVQYDSTEKMLDAADRLEERSALLLKPATRSPFRPSSTHYSRR